MCLSIDLLNGIICIHVSAVNVQVIKIYSQYLHRRT